MPSWSGRSLFYTEKHFGHTSGRQGFFRECYHRAAGHPGRHELMVERSEAEGPRTPRPHAGDHPFTESEFEGLQQTYESVRSDHARHDIGHRGDVLRASRTAERRFVSFGMQRPSDAMRSDWQKKFANVVRICSRCVGGPRSTEAAHSTCFSFRCRPRMSCGACDRSIAPVP